LIVAIEEAFCGFTSIYWFAFLTDCRWFRAISFIKLINDDTSFLDLVTLCSLAFFVEFRFNCPYDAIKIGNTFFKTDFIFDVSILAFSSIYIACVLCANRSVITRGGKAIANDLSRCISGARCGWFITCISWSAIFLAFIAFYTSRIGCWDSNTNTKLNITRSNRTFACEILRDSPVRAIKSISAQFCGTRTNSSVGDLDMYAFSR
jgi:hypothetical protein